MGTLPSEVTADTAIASLDLSWDEHELPRHERRRHVHGLYPLAPRCVPQVAEVLLRRYFRPGQTVYDPLARAGMTLVEAGALGVHAVGRAPAPFDALLCRAKTAHYDLAHVRSEALDIVSRTERAWDARTAQLELLPTAPPDDEAYLRTWYAPRALQQLLTYRGLVAEYEYGDLLRVILARVARAARLAPHPAFDLATEPVSGPYWCDRHGRTCRPARDARRFLRGYTLDSLTRLEEYARARTHARVLVAGTPAPPPIPVDGIVAALPGRGTAEARGPHRDARAACALLGLPRRAEDEGSGDSAGQVLLAAAAALGPGAPIVVIGAGDEDPFDDPARGAGLALECVVPWKAGGPRAAIAGAARVWRTPNTRA